jgi:hypothetical protein
MTKSPGSEKLVDTLLLRQPQDNYEKIPYESGALDTFAEMPESYCKPECSWGLTTMQQENQPNKSGESEYWRTYRHGYPDTL